MTHEAYSERFDDALALAAEAFRHVFRKGGTIPYITHLMSVASMVGEAGGDEDQIIAAILHDLLEDIDGYHHQQLADRFGHDVADLVLDLSDSVGKPRPPWRQRKDAYLAKLVVAPARVKLVSACDKLHNARTLARDYRLKGEITFERFNGKSIGTRWYFRAVHQALSTDWSHPWLLDELAREINQFDPA